MAREMFLFASYSELLRPTRQTPTQQTPTRQTHHHIDFCFESNRRQQITKRQNGRDSLQCWHDLVSAVRRGLPGRLYFYLRLCGSGRRNIAMQPDPRLQKNSTYTQTRTHTHRHTLPCNHPASQPACHPKCSLMVTHHSHTTTPLSL